jgi:hypothetical protein
MFAQSIVALGFIALVQPTGVTGAPEDARVVLTRALIAHGGAETIAKYQARHIKVRGTLTSNRNLPFVHELFYQAPGQIRDVLTVEADGKRSTITCGFDGDNGWALLEGKATALPESMKAELKEAAHLARLSGLHGVLAPGTETAALPAIEVGGRSAVGVRVATKGYRDVSLYFDKESGLLVKAEHPVLDAATQKLVKEERFYGGWKVIHGLRTPTQVVIIRDGKKFMQAEAVEVEVLEKLDAGLFRRP